MVLKVYSCNIKTDELLCRFNIFNISFSHKLNIISNAEVSCEIPTDIGFAFPYKTYLVIMWNETVLWSGIITNCSIDYKEEKFTLNALDWLHYFEKRLCPSLVFKKTDQMTILRSLLNTANDIDLILDMPRKSNALRSVTYHEEDGDDIYSRLSNLSSTKDGFFYFCYFKIKNDILQKFLKIIYPRQPNNKKYKLMNNVNCEISETGYQGMYIATHGVAFSTLQDKRFLKIDKVQEKSITEQYPILQKKWKFDDVADPFNLDNKLQDKMHMYSRPHQYFKCNIFFNENFPIGVGDQIDLTFNGQHINCFVSDISNNFSGSAIQQEIDLKETEFLLDWTR